MPTSLYRSTDLADRIEALLVSPAEPRNDTLSFKFEAIEPVSLLEDADSTH